MLLSFTPIKDTCHICTLPWSFSWEVLLGGSRNDDEDKTGEIERVTKIAPLHDVLFTIVMPH